MFSGFRGATSTTRTADPEKNFIFWLLPFTFLLTFAAKNLIYKSHCDFRIAKFDVRENQSMKSATKKAAPKKKAPAKKKK
jgi:hypothetical protein